MWHGTDFGRFVRASFLFGWVVPCVIIIIIISMREDRSFRHLIGALLLLLQQ